MSIKRVAIYGATGNLGPAIVHALVDATFEVTVFTRNDKPQPGLPSSAKVQQLDFESPSAITSALKGYDALVSTVGTPGLAAQSQVFDAAAEAGVRFIIPSEFGCDTTNAHAVKLPVFADKIKVQQHLAELAKAGKVSFALVQNNAFLDWGLDLGFVVNVHGETSRVFDGGDVEFSATLLSDVGKAVAGVLKDPEQFKNKQVRVNSAVVTQNQLLALARKHGKETPTAPVTTEQTLEKSYADLKAGQNVHAAIFGFLFVALFTPSYGTKFPQDDSERLGIERLSEAEVEQVVVDSIKKKSN